MRKILCTFANYPLSKGFERYRKEAEAFNVFDDIYMYDENMLDKRFRTKFGRFLYPYSRGYGYWGWKPFIIKQTLDKMEEGDILLYTDLGCTFNQEGKKRLIEYFNIVNQSESGILCARTQDEEHAVRKELAFFEYQYTKGDILDYFSVRDNIDFTQTRQFEAGIVFYRKGPKVEAFLKEWIEAVYNHFDFITDKPSRSANIPGFIDNRHDQSVFSILAKKYRIAEFSRNELCPNEFDNLDWGIMKEYPIWAKREVYYKSMWHYQHRFSLRKYYNILWGIKYSFKRILHPRTYHI
ncbi:hypothetical protein [Dysgonomonas sp. BGC7]|uniref:hypothetical protein n=1 Tax=Dysgonomonas sp. BGC7 TaxID=1658008 RepID=UPI0006831F68|nr:hypothetical protein [Dysgonomonas sp. BGC7]MBD8388022.1 hypothetical protein [Dysgonomonas sp. BGC7]